MIDKELGMCWCKRHPLPMPDKDYCSCCRKAIVHGYDNVIEITKTPTVLNNFEGQEIGKEGHARLKAVLHTKCAEAMGLGGRKIECKYCGVFCGAKTLKDGQSIFDHCKCQCHKGKAVCLLLF